MIGNAPGQRSRAAIPVGMLVLVLLPLILMPIAAVFVFALKGGPGEFWKAFTNEDAQFALRFSLLIAFCTAAINAVLGTWAAYVLSKYRFRGERPLAIAINLPVAIPTVVVGTSLLLLWGPIGLFGKLLEPLGPAADVHPGRGAPRPPLRHLPLHARGRSNRCSTSWR